MKPQEVTVSCHYSKEETGVARILQSSFDSFLKKELQNAAKYPYSATYRKQ